MIMCNTLNTRVHTGFGDHDAMSRSQESLKGKTDFPVLTASQWYVLVAPGAKLKSV